MTHYTFDHMGHASSYAAKWEHEMASSSLEREARQARKAQRSTSKSGFLAAFRRPVRALRLVASGGTAAL